jgi:hypothetical protein
VSERCTRAEVLAGAIALDEASAAEREEYRNHCAICPACVRAFGGEREIERVMARVAHAREAETWDPVPRRRASHGHVLPLRILAILAAAAVVAAPQLVAVERLAVEPDHRIVLNEHPLRELSPRFIEVPAQPEIPVVASTSAPPVLYLPIAQATAPASDVPIWRRDEAMPVTAQAPEIAPVFSGKAESMVMVQLTCRVTKSSGRPELDAAACKAAMAPATPPSQR